MALKWMNLTSSFDTIHKIPRLIWTDIAANIMIGSKSVLNAFPDHKMEVQIFRRKITYNYVYAIPALISWIIWLGSLIIILSGFAGLQKGQVTIVHEQVDKNDQ